MELFASLPTKKFNYPPRLCYLTSLDQTAPLHDLQHRLMTIVSLSIGEILMMSSMILILFDTQQNI